MAVQPLATEAKCHDISEERASRRLAALLTALGAAPPGQTGAGGIGIEAKKKANRVLKWAVLGGRFGKLAALPLGFCRLCHTVYAPRG